MNRLRTIMIFGSLSSLRARRLAHQIEHPTWVKGTDCKFVGTAILLSELCEEISEHGYTPIPPTSEWARMLLESTETEVVRIPHPEGEKTWVIPVGAHIHMGGCEMVLS